MNHKKKTSGSGASVRHSETVYQGDLFSFQVETIILPNGKKTEMAVVRHPGSTGIVPLHDDGTVTMTRQYRYPVDDYILEIPAGTMDPGESPRECAGRELEEETGLVAKTLIDLGPIHILPAYSDEIIHLFLARDFTTTTQKLDDDEIIDVVKYPLDTLMDMIHKGGITDSLTILSLQRVWYDRTCSRG
jgi:ADP-ribose pyrophosphatase